MRSGRSSKEGSEEKNPQVSGWCVGEVLQKLIAAEVSPYHRLTGENRGRHYMKAVLADVDVEYSDLLGAVSSWWSVSLLCA
jgi:hypothetical protein